MELNTPIRIIIFVVLLIGNSYMVYTTEKPGGFTKAAYVLAMTHMGFYAYKFLFGF